MTMTGSAICSHKYGTYLQKYQYDVRGFPELGDGETAEKVADGGGFDLYLFMEPGEFASMKKRQRYPRSQYFCIGAKRNAGICRKRCHLRGLSVNISVRRILPHIPISLFPSVRSAQDSSQEGSFLLFPITSSCGGRGKRHFSDACQIAAAEKKNKRAHCQHFSAV